MKCVGKMAVLLLALLPVTACTAVIDGSVRPAAGLAPKPLTGAKVKGVLLDRDTLAKMLDQGFEDTPSYSHYGGGDEALNSNPDASPADCAVSVAPMTEGSYPADDVKQGAREIWWNDHSDDDAKAIDVEEGVVALATAADADALFQKITEEWKNCDGTKVTARGDTYSISGVAVADSVLAASGEFSSIPQSRALGVRVNCVVEVDITYYSSTYPGTDDRIAIDMARAMMAKISEQS